MDDNPVERLLTVLPPDAEMPAAASVRSLLRRVPHWASGYGTDVAREMVEAVASLAATAEEARLPLALPARMAANRLAAARRGQVLAWMRAAASH